MIRPLICVAGTWGKQAPEQWCHPMSGWAKPFLEGGYVYANAYVPFEWTCRVDGIVGAHHNWEAGGAALRYYIDAYARDVKPTVICHSHGGQLPAWCRAGIDTLVTVGTPVRDDVPYSDIKARRWIHFYAPRRWNEQRQEMIVDTWAYSGGGDGPMPLATVNVPVDGLDPMTAHGDLLDAESILAALG